MITGSREVVAGYTVTPDARNPRIQRVKIAPDALQTFLEKAHEEELQYGLLEPFRYVPFARLRLAQIMLESAGQDLGETLISILQDWSMGAFSLEITGIEDVNHRLRVATAISYLLGDVRCDAQNSHFAHFTITDERRDDPPLLNPYFVLPFHTDGTFYPGHTDWLLFLKTVEQSVIGGESTLLHVADWTEREKFASHDLAKREFIFRGPSSSDVRRGDLGNRGDMGELSRTFFFERKGVPAFRFTFQWVHPRNIEEANYVTAMHISLMAENDKSVFPLGVGELYCVNNRLWLHGRMPMQRSTELRREAYRIFGSFSCD